MKSTKFLLLGLIFALTCSVSFAGRSPGKMIPIIEMKKEVVQSLPVSQAIVITCVDIFSVAVADISYQVNLVPGKRAEAVITDPFTYNPRRTVRSSTQSQDNYCTSNYIIDSSPGMISESNRKMAISPHNLNKPLSNWKHYLYWQPIYPGENYNKTFCR